MSHERTRRKNTQRASEMNLAAILLCIVVVFIICHFPRILLNVHELFMLDNMLECGESGIFDGFFSYGIVTTEFLIRQINYSLFTHDTEKQHIYSDYNMFLFGRCTHLHVK